MKEKLFKKHARFLLSAIPLTLPNAFLELRLNSEVNLLAFHLFSIWLIYTISFQIKPLRTLILTLISFGCSMLVQVFILFLFGLFAFLDNNPYIGLIGNGLTIVMCFLLYLMVPLHRLYTLIISRSPVLLSGIVNIAGIMLMLNIYYKINGIKTFTLLLSILFPLLLFLLINILCIQEAMQLQAERKKLEEYQNYLPLIDEMVFQVRKRQHAFDNQLQAIQMMSDSCSDYETLRRKLLDYMHYVNAPKTDLDLLKVNLKCLAAFLFQKIHEAKEKKNITVQLTILNSSIQTKAPEYELIDMVGIIFDNMVDATPVDGVCVFTIDSIDHQFRCLSLNPGPLLTPELRASFFVRGYTTKNNNDHSHGLGLCILMDKIKKYSGTIYLENEMIGPENGIQIEILV